MSNQELSKPSSLAKNRRLRYLETVLRSSDFFSDQSMRMREPELYQQYVGKHISDKEKQREYDALEDNLVERIYYGVQEAEAAEALKTAENLSAETFQEFDSDEEESPEPEMTLEQRETLKGDFIRLMEERFLSGKDVEFLPDKNLGYGYADIDNDESLDDLDRMSREKEDEYFEEKPLQKLSAEDRLRHRESQIDRDYDY